MTRPGLAATCLALAVAGIGCGEKNSDGKRSRDIAENRVILRQLPVLPGARVLKTTSAPYYREEKGPPVGHTTNIVYVAPRDTRDEEVIEFYAEKLRARWRCRRESIGIRDLDSPSPRGRVLILSCTRGTALVSVNTDAIEATPPRFEVVVDHRGGTRHQAE